MILEKMKKSLRCGWLYAIIAILVLSLSGCTEEKKAEAPGEDGIGVNEAAAPTEACPNPSLDAADAADDAESDPGVRDDIPVKGFE